VRHPRFADYWSRVRPARNKWGTILAHEQRWERDLAAADLTSGVLVDSRELRTRRNPMTFTWREVIRRGVPYLKRSLFLANPDRVDMRGWREFLAEVTPGFDVGVVERDLRRMGREPPG
jgi:hypothetical protein